MDIEGIQETREEKVSFMHLQLTKTFKHVDDPKFRHFNIIQVFKYIDTRIKGTQIKV